MKTVKLLLQALCGVALMLTVNSGLAQSAPAEDSGKTFQEMGKQVDDAVITTSIKLKYAHDKALDPFKIGVNTEKGNVTLDGMVNTDAEFEQAVMLAESTDGANDVNADNLKVKDSQQPLTDMIITAKVKGKILKEKLFGDKDVTFWSVSVETKNGVVYFSGEVDNDQQKQSLTNIAKSVDGVTDVNLASLKVKVMDDSASSDVTPSNN